MKHKLLFFFVVLFSAVQLFANGIVIDGINYVIGGDTATITYQGEDYHNNNYSGVLIIPSSVTYESKTYSVTTIGDYAFYGCSGLTSVTIPNSVTTIGNYAFYKCSSLTSITIPNSVITIGMLAFYGCIALNSPIYNANNFAYMPPLYEGAYAIPEGIIQIASGAFWDCHNLTSVTIPSSITTIGGYAFYLCRGLTSVTIPSSITTIGEYAFAYVNNIVYNGTAIGSPWGAKCINGYVEGDLVYTDETKKILCGCSSVATSKIVIPNSVRVIKDMTFYQCQGLITIEIPSSVTTIESYAFSGCSGLTSVTIPNSVTMIGDRAFYECSGLSSVTINSNAICSRNYTSSFNFQNIFGSQVKEYIIGTSVTTIGQYIFCGCIGCSSLTIPYSVTTIGNYAFKDCYSLSSVTIPSSVTKIGDYAFSDCRKLFDIYCYAIEPPVAQTSSFANYNVYLHVPCDNLRDYQMDAVFGSFKYVECISAEQTQTDDHVTVTPSDYNATFTWPQNDQAAGYSIEITKDGVVFCTLKFNAQGQLTGIAFAPGRGGEQRTMPAATMTANGWQFTVTGLNQASKYGYTLDATNASQQSIKHYEGEFTTTGATRLEWLTVDNARCTIRKMIIDNQLFIFRGGKIFNAAGVLLK